MLRTAQTLGLGKLSVRVYLIQEPLEELRPSPRRAFDGVMLSPLRVRSDLAREGSTCGFGRRGHVASISADAVRRVGDTPEALVRFDENLTTAIRQEVGTL
jgi:hypothetical protein